MYNQASFTFLTLPERQEDDRLNGAELKNGFKRREKFLSGKVEHVEAVQSKTDGKVVDYGDVQVASIQAN